jgi:serine/threonine-protein kinase
MLLCGGRFWKIGAAETKNSAGKVEALMAFKDKTLDWLKRPVDLAARELAFIGRTIGSYVLLRLVGEGGMGSVFLAERADNQYQQLAAIKLMHAEMLQANAMLERFRDRAPDSRQSESSEHRTAAGRSYDGGGHAIPGDGVCRGRAAR